jgi:tetratricopeptide (TPR) repeat protein
MGSRFLALLFVLGLLPWGASASARERDRTPPPSMPAAVAVAEDPPPPPADAPTRVQNDYARLMFSREKYLVAAETLERAYSRDPNPILLFNAAQVYRKGGHYAESLRLYERFLVVAPKHPLAVDARDHVRTLQILLSQEDKKKEIEIKMEQTQQEIDRLRKPPLYKRVWFWATIVGGTAAVVAVGVGVKVYQDQRATDSGLLSLQF